MASPMLHLATGVAVFAVATPLARRRLPFWLLAALFFCLFPDYDALPGFVAGDLGPYHNQWFHAPLVTLPAALVVAGLMARVSTTAVVQRWGREWVPVAGCGRMCAVAAVCVLIHLGLDFITDGRGLMLLWPFSAERFRLDPPLLRGLVWSEGWISAEHVRTFRQELPWTLLVLCGSVCTWALRVFRARAVRNPPSAAGPGRPAAAQSARGACWRG